MLPLYFWRRARLPMVWFPFHEVSSAADYLDLVVDAASKQELAALVVERLLGRPNGHVARTLGRRVTSEVRREIASWGDLFVSLVAGHHTGRKGAVQAFGVDTSRLEPVSEDFLSSIASLSRLPSVLVGAESDSTPEKALESMLKLPPPPSYCLLGDSSTPGLPATYEQISKTASVVHTAVRELADSVWDSASSSAWVVAADLLIADARPLGFEVHVPGRVLGPVVLAALAGEIRAGRRESMLSTLEGFGRRTREEAAIDSVGRAEQPQRQGVAGHIDRAYWCASLGLDPLGHESARPVGRALLHELSANGYREIDGRRSYWFERLGVSVMCEGVVANTLTDVESMATGNGWVVVKDNANRPWWHQQKARVWFCNTQFSRDRRRIERALGADTIWVERLVSDSIDQLGRSGEVRVYSVIW